MPPIRPIAAIVAVVALAIGGCARRESVVDAGIRGQVLHLGNQSEPQDLDPHLVTAYTDQNIILALFEGLCAIDERSSTAVPAAAESWESSPDGLVWTFRLRENLRWGNGDPLTASDFVASWRRILSPSLAAEYAYLLHPLKNAAAINSGDIADPAALGAEAVDKRMIRLTLERPTPYLPALTAQPAWFPVNPRVLARFGPLHERSQQWTRPENLVGNGPFRLDDWAPQSRLSVVRNAAYWDAASVRLNGIVFYPTGSPDVEERNFRAGQVHITYSLPSSKLPAYRDQPATPLRVDPFLQTIFLRFNVTRPPFGDPRVRRALSLAIDREAIVGSVLRGAARPAHHFTPPDSAGYTARARVGLDYESSRRLLAEAGFPGGAGFPEVEIQVRNDDVQPRMAEILQAHWKRELGITIAIISVEQKTWVQNQQSLDYAVSGAGWIGDFVDPVTFLDLFVSGGGNNWTGWGDPGYDRLIAEAGRAVDPARRYELFQQAESILLESAAVAPVFFGARAHLVHPAVRNWEPALLGFHQYKKVYLQSP